MPFFAVQATMSVREVLDELMLAVAQLVAVVDGADLSPYA